MAVSAVAFLVACGGDGGSDDGAGGSGGGGGAAVCGNGVMEPGEDCDRGADNSDQRPNACRTDCRLFRCGDGTIDRGEACDGGAFCSAACALQPGCGNGVREGDEACDEGAANSDALPGACRTDCTEARCGDAVVDAGESCDDGAANSDVAPGACRTSCVPAFCGDGVVDAGETCDDGDANSDIVPGACRTSCAPARCGDGVLDGDEVCDDGAANSDSRTDACRTTCVPAFCGDGVADAGEACDDGAGNSDVAPDACRIGCAAPRCGDGVVDTGEGCDDGAANSDRRIDACRTSCAAAHCGDGVVDTGEACDDGNADDGDGCSAACAREDVCGDGVRAFGEACDDGNLLAGDGCDGACRLEAGVCGAAIVDLNAVGNFGGAGTRVAWAGTLAGAGNDSSGACTSGDGEELALAFWVGARSRVSFTTEAGASFDGDTLLYVRTSCADPDTEIACNDDIDTDMGRYASAVVLDDVAAGTQLYVFVDTWGEDGPGIDFAIEGTIRPIRDVGEPCDPFALADVCAPGAICPAGTCIAAVCGDGLASPEVGEQCDDGGTTDGDGCTADCQVEGGSCATALVPAIDPVTHVAQVSGTTASAGDDVQPSCGEGLRNADAFVTFTAPVAAAWDFTSTATFDTVLAAQAACGDDASEIACSNSAPFDPAGGDVLRVVLDAGETVTLVVDGWGAPGTAEGEFQLVGTPRPIVGEGGACDASAAANVCAAGLYCHDSGGVCTRPACGNGSLEAGEACDDGNLRGGDGCSAACAWETVPEVEPNDTPAQAMTIAPGAIYAGTIGPRDVETFSFAATAGTPYTIETSVGSPGACTATPPNTNDTTLILFDTDGTTELARDWWDGACPQIAFTPSASGTYYVQFREFFPNGTRVVDPWFLVLR